MRIRWILVLLYYNGVSFEKRVGFMRGQEKGIKRWEYFDSVPESNLPIVTKVFFVWKAEFSKP
jgi:hypothetical protein